MCLYYSHLFNITSVNFGSPLMFSVLNVCLFSIFVSESAKGALCMCVCFLTSHFSHLKRYPSSVFAVRA